jgi:hypothetical protein
MSEVIIPGTRRPRRASLAIRPPAPTRKGRPRLPEDQRLPEIIQFRAKTVEADRIYRGALREGISVSAFLRARLAAILAEDSCSK